MPDPGLPRAAPARRGLPLLASRAWGQASGGGGFVGLMVNGAATLVLAGGAWAGLQFVERHPVRSVEIVEVEPADRVVDRAAGGHLDMVRRVCAARDAVVRVEREWVDAAGGRMPTVDDWAGIMEGCHVRPAVKIWPPGSLNPGLHRYRVRLVWCNEVRCREVRLQDVEVLLVGHEPVPPRPPERAHF